MVSGFCEHQRCSHARGQNVLHQVGQVNGLPNGARLQRGLLIRELRETCKVRAWFAERRVLELDEALDVPTLNVFGACIHVNGEIKEVTDHQRGARLQNVEALQNEDVRLIDDLVLAFHHVIRIMRVDRCLHIGAARLDLGDKAQQIAAMVGLRKTFPAHQIAAFQLIRGQEEAVRGDKVHARVRIPALQKHLEHTRCR